MTKDAVIVLAVASGGGHWRQLMQLKDVLPAGQTLYASPLDKAATGLVEEPYIRIIDGNRDTKCQLIRCVWQLLMLILKCRPRIILSTGAAPGCLAILIGKRLGAQCLFIDSVANAGELSMSARLAKKHGALVYSQWPDVAAKEGVLFAGSVFAGLVSPTELLAATQQAS